MIEVDTKLYMRRFYIKHNGMLPGIYLHHFLLSDPDRDLHNHPWKWALSVILAGGYYEYRHNPNIALGYLEPEIHEHKAPSLNFIKGTTFHRVVLKDLKNGAWTLFMSGPEVRTWGFLTTAGRFIRHDDYLGGV